MANWSPDVSVRSQFGHLCSGNVFAHGMYFRSNSFLFSVILGVQVFFPEASNELVPASGMGNAESEMSIDIEMQAHESEREMMRSLKRSRLLECSQTELPSSNPASQNPANELSIFTKHPGWDTSTPNNSVDARRSESRTPTSHVKRRRIDHEAGTKSRSGSPNVVTHAPNALLVNRKANGLHSHSPDQMPNPPSIGDSVSDPATFFQTPGSEIPFASYQRDLKEGSWKNSTRDLKDVPNSKKSTASPSLTREAPEGSPQAISNSE